MIGLIQGILVEKHWPEVLIDVQGIGYEVSMPLNAISQLGELGARVKVFTHFVVREDAQQLYGFIDELDRRLFRDLIKTNGVGPKLAIAILSSMEVKHFVEAVTCHDSQALVRIPGVGKKTAERLVIEMSDRLKKWDSAVWQNASGAVSAHADDVQGTTDSAAQNVQALKLALHEAEEALISLGYKPVQASKALGKVRGEATATGDLIRLSLKELARA